MRKIIAAAALLGASVLGAVAYAEPVQEFSFQIKDVRSGGRFTVEYTSRSYDTTGAVPVSPNEFHLRLPFGARLRSEFLRRRVLCNVKRLDREREPSACGRSQIGTGRVLVDARPFITELIPADLWLFLAKGATRRAVASLAILGKPDPDAPIVRNTPVVRDFRAPIVFMNFFDDPTPDRRYGYKLMFGNSPTGGGGVSFSIAETRVTNSGFTLNRSSRRCSRRRAGTCVRRQVRRKRLFWFTPPACPPSRKVSFEAFFGYASLPDITKVTELSCPRFPS